MRILHTSDWHLGISLNRQSLIIDQRHIIDEICKIAEKEKIELVILAGDIFDTRIAKSDAVELYDYAMTKLCIELNVKVLVVPGNHDNCAQLSSCGKLLEKAGLYIAGDAGRLSKNVLTPYSFEDVDIYAIPYFCIDDVRVAFDEKDISDYQDAMKAVCEKIAQIKNKSKSSIVVSHAYVGGATVAESDRAAIVGTAQMVSKNIFKDFDYVAMGHLHGRQHLDNVHYCGAPLKYSASEAGHIKSVNVIDTTNMSVQQIELVALRDLKVLEMTKEQALTNDTEIYDYMDLTITDAFLTPSFVDEIILKYPNLIRLRSVFQEDISHFSKNANTYNVDGKNEVEILKMFFEQNGGYTITDRHIKMFEQALLFVKNEGGEQ